MTLLRIILWCDGRFSSADTTAKSTLEAAGEAVEEKDRVLDNDGLSLDAAYFHPWDKTSLHSCTLCRIRNSRSPEQVGGVAAAVHRPEPSGCPIPLLSKCPACAWNRRGPAGGGTRASSRTSHWGGQG
mmetsp:Transcript_18390/g.39931  ORF Transcript_18390/g.39931 Transcript_18390/m.39931 type:complete len:128 (+) Transcript_18390:81-464(+)